MSNALVISLKVNMFVDWVALISKGAMDGILIFGTTRLLIYLRVDVGEYIVSCIFKNATDDLAWVYGLVVGSLRENF